MARVICKKTKQGEISSDMVLYADVKATICQHGQDHVARTNKVALCEV